MIDIFGYLQVSCQNIYMSSAVGVLVNENGERVCLVRHRSAYLSLMLWCGRVFLSTK